MKDFIFRGYRIQTIIKIPHLHENERIFYYQFLIYDKKGKLMNYPFSRILARDDNEFKIKLQKDFIKIITDKNALKNYPVSNYIANIQAKP